MILLCYRLFTLRFSACFYLNIPRWLFWRFGVSEQPLKIKTPYCGTNKALFELQVKSGGRWRRRR